MWDTVWVQCSADLSHNLSFQKNIALHKGDSHSVSGAVQLLPLLSQLLDDVVADLLCLVGDLLTSLDALAGVIQRLTALKQQGSLRLQVCLHRRSKIIKLCQQDFEISDSMQKFSRLRIIETHTLLVLGWIDAMTSFLCLSGETKCRSRCLHVPLQLPEVSAVQTQLSAHSISVGGGCSTQLIFHTL